MFRYNEMFYFEYFILKTYLFPYDKCDDNRAME